MSEQMRVTIIPADTFCAVDGVGFNGVDMTGVANDVHAVQWYGTWGEQEIADVQTGKIVRNEEINDLDAYQSVLASYWEIRNAEEAARQEIDDEQTIVEV